MLAALELGGNPSSIHAEGRAARHAIEDAREKLAALIGAPPRSIVFTSGGTEANAMALSPAWLPGHGSARLFISSVEHASVLRGGQFAAGDVELLPVNADGVISLEAAREAFCARHAVSAPFLVSVMLANNETGAIQPVSALAALAHDYGGLVHCDAAQAVGKIAVDASAIGADLLTVSAHKFGGPKGVGALAVLRDGLPVAALVSGGGQERGYRAGTEDVAAIAGMGAAADAVAGNDGEQRKIAALRDEMEAQIAGIAPEAVFFSRQADASAEYKLLRGRRHVGGNFGHRDGYAWHRGQRGVCLLIGEGRAQPCAGRDGRAARAWRSRDPGEPGMEYDRSRH